MDSDSSTWPSWGLSLRVKWGAPGACHSVVPVGAEMYQREELASAGPAGQGSATQPTTLPPPCLVPPRWWDEGAGAEAALTGRGAVWCLEGAAWASGLQFPLVCDGHRTTRPQHACGCLEGSQ